MASSTEYSDLLRQAERLDREMTQVKEEILQERNELRAAAGKPEIHDHSIRAGKGEIEDSEQPSLPSPKPLKFSLVGLETPNQKAGASTPEAKRVSYPLVPQRSNDERVPRVGDTKLQDKQSITPAPRAPESDAEKQERLQSQGSKAPNNYESVATSRARAVMPPERAVRAGTHVKPVIFDPPNMSSKKYKMAEIRKHNKRNDCWIIYAGRVYDVTPFLKEHPGGADLILNNAGTDVSALMASNNHPRHAYYLLSKHQIGFLDLSEAIAHSSPRLLSSFWRQTSSTFLSFFTWGPVAIISGVAALAASAFYAWKWWGWGDSLFSIFNRKPQIAADTTPTTTPAVVVRPATVRPANVVLV